jgi:hypothetical protein
MTTVGYGDEFPVTSLGRVVAIMAALAAVIMLAITVNLVVSKLTLSRSETKVLDVSTPSFYAVTEVAHIRSS